MANIGELGVSVLFQPDEASIQRTAKYAEQTLSKSLTLRMGLDDSEIRAALSQTSTIQKQAARESVQAEKQANEEKRADRQRYVNFWKQSLSEQEAAEKQAAQASAQAQREKDAEERRAYAEGMQRLRNANQTALMNARLSAQAEREAARTVREAAREAQAQKGIRQEAIDAQRLAYSRLRAEFDAGEKDIAGFNSAALTLIATLKKLEGQTDFTTKELKQLSDLRGRVERESNSVASVLNPASLSGNVSIGVQHGMTALLTGLSQITAMSPSLGAAASNLGIVAQNFTLTRAAAASAAGGMNGAATAAGFMSAGAATLGLGLAALGGGFVSLASTGIEQTKILQRGVNVLRANGEQDIDGFAKKISELKANLGGVGEFFSRADLTASSAEIVKAGASSAEALTLMATSAKLAAAENISLNDASQMLLKNLRGYGQGVGEAAKLGDQLAQAGLLASGSAAELSRGFNNVGSTALQANLGTSKLLAMLVELDNSGLSAADRGSEGLRSALASLADLSKEGAAQLHSWGIATEDSSGKARAAGDILVDLTRKVGDLGIRYNAQTGELEGNGEALRGVSSIMDTAAAAAVLNLKGKWVEYDKTIRDSTGSLDKYTDAMTSGLEPAQKRLATAWADLGGAMTKSFAGPLADMLTTLSGVVTKMGELFEKMSAVQNIKELKTVFKIEAGDDTTAAIIKFLGRRVVDIGYGVEGVKAGIEKTGFAQNLRKLDTFGLQSELQRMGVVPTPAVGNIKGLADQFNMIGKDMEGWRKRLQAAYAAEEATRKAGAKGLTLPNYLPESLRPGRTANLGTGLPSGDTLNKMNPGFQRLMGQLMVDYIAKNPSGLAPYIHEGFRTIERQNELYAQGRSKPGNIVTNAKGGQSIHNYGVAADIYWRDPKTGKVVSFDDPRAVEAAKALGQLATAKRLLWGGSPGFGLVDMPHIQENISWQAAAKKYGAVDTPSPPAPSTKSWQDYEKEARRIIGQINKYASDGAAPNGEKWTAATAALKAFTKDNDLAAAAVAWVQSEIKKADKDVSKYGQTFDKLKGQLDVTESLQKLGQDVAPQLKTIRSEAEKAAAAEKARNGETEKYRQLLNLAGDAAGKLSSLTKKAETDEKTAAQNRLKTQQDLQTALSRGQEQQAQTLLDRLKAQQAKELDLARDSAAKRAQITAQSGPAIIAAEDKLAQIKRERAVKAAQDEANRAKALPGADLAAVEATRVAAVRQAYATEKQEREKARSEQAQAQRQANQTALQAQQQHEKERKKLIAQAAQEARQLRYDAADTTLNRVKADNKAELDAFRGTAAEKLALLRKQTQEEFEAAEVVARIKKQKRVRELENQYAGKPNDPTFLAAKKLAEQQYADTVAGLKNARIAAIRGAQDDLNRAMQDIVNSPESKGFRDAYTLNLIPGANGFNGTGSDASGLYRYAEQRDALQGIKDAFAGLGDNAADAASIVEHDLIPQVEAIINKTDDAQLKQAAQDYLKFLKDSKIELLSLAELQDAFNKVRLDAIEAGQSVVAGGEGVLDAFRRQDAQDAMMPGNSTVDVMELLRFDPVAVLDMGETMGQDFIDGVLGSVNGESLSWLGADTLQGLIDAVGSDPKWADFKKKLEESLKLARDLAAEIDDLLRQRDAQVGVSGFLPDNTNPADVMTVDADASAQAFDDLRDSIKGMTDEQLKLMTTDPVFAANTEMKSAALAELARRADATKEALAQLPAVQAQLELNSLERAHSAGKVGDNWYVGEKERLQTLLENLRFERAIIGKTQTEIEVLTLEHQDKLSAIEDEGRAGRKANAEKDAALTLARVKAQNDRELALMEGGKSLSARLNYINRKQQLDEQAAQAEYDTAVKGGKDVETAAATLEAALIRIRQTGSAARQQLMQNELDMLTANFQKAGQIAKMFTDGGENAVSILGDWVTMNTTAYKQFMSGDVAGAVLTTIEGILNVGESIASLNPQLREYKKNMLEIAQLEKEAMGSKKYGNIANPYYDDLAKDAANREKLGNSKWYQRLWWGLTGSTPQVMEDGAAKLKAKAAEIFGELADGINTLWNNAWEKAFTDGTSLDLTANLTKMLNLEVAKAAMAQVLEKANIGEYLKAYTDARAAGQDGAAQLEALRQALLKAGQDADAILKTLPGYGEGDNAAERDRAVRGEGLNTEETLLKVQLAAKLISQREYEEKVLELTLRRYALEREAILANIALSEEERQAKLKLLAAQEELAKAEAEAARLRAIEEMKNSAFTTKNQAAQTLLDLEENAALRLTESEEEQYRIRLKYAEKRKALKLEELNAQEAIEKAGVDMAVEGAQALLDAITEKYRVARLAAGEEIADLIEGEEDRLRKLGEAAAEEARRAGEEAAKGYASGLTGGIDAMLRGGNAADVLRGKLRGMLAGALDKQLSEQLSANLAPQLKLALDPATMLQGLDGLRSGFDATFTAIAPPFEALVKAIEQRFPELAKSTDNLNKTMQEKEFKTEYYVQGSTQAANSLRGQLLATRG